MKFSSRFVFFFSLLLLLGCAIEEVGQPLPIQDQPDSRPEEPNEPETEVYFTLNVFNKTDASSSSEWVILHNSKGDLLDYSEYQIGDNLVFEAPSDSLTETITVTNFREVKIESGAKFYTLQSATEIPKGTTDDLGAPGGSSAATRPERTGNFTITIQDIPGDYVLNISTKYGPIAPGGSGFSRNGFWTFTVDDMPIYDEEVEYLISITDGNNQVRYHTFKNLSGLNQEVEYSSFKQFDSVVSTALPPHDSFRLNVLAFEEGIPFDQWNGFWIHDASSFAIDKVETNPLLFGYLDRWERYKTSFSIRMDDYSYTINSYGPKLEGIIIPEKPNFEILTNNLGNFDFSVGIASEKITHYWKKQEGSSETNDLVSTRWIISHAPSFRPIIGALPTEILSLYPYLQIDALKYDSTLLSLLKEDERVHSSSESIYLYHE